MVATGMEFPEDYELWLRWSKGVKMERVNQILVDWFDSKERMSGLT